MAERIRYADGAIPADVSQHTLGVLFAAMRASSVEAITITSTQRSALQQARVMINNLLRPNGLAKSRMLYREPGQKVIDVWEQMRSQHASLDQILHAMVRKIEELGPATVSHHCADPRLLNVLDIAPSSIPEPKREAFITALQSDQRVAKLLLPSQGDPAFHLEIPQPQTAAVPDSAPQSA